MRAVIVASLDNLFGACNEPIRLLWGTDDFAAAGELMNLDTAWLEKRERDQLSKANKVVAISEYLAVKWRTTVPEVIVIPNGCDAEMYAGVDDAPLPPDVTLPGPIAGFVGLLSDRIDLNYLEAVARTGRSLLLVGPRQPGFGNGRFDDLVGRTNVQWVGPKPFTELPSYLSVMSVGLTPYSQSQFNQASFPLKTLEYLAAGLPAVSTDIAAAHWLDTELITICSTAEGFASSTVLALDTPVDPGLVKRRMSLAQRHSWKSRAEEFVDLLDVGT